jgi:hypothetical protein
MDVDKKPEIVKNETLDVGKITANTGNNNAYDKDIDKDNFDKKEQDKFISSDIKRDFIHK